jgi:hypothetical protein
MWQIFLIWKKLVHWYCKAILESSACFTALELKEVETLITTKYATQIKDIKHNFLLQQKSPRSLQSQSHINKTLSRIWSNIWLLLPMHVFIMKKHYRGFEMAQTFVSYKCWVKWKPQVASACLYIVIIMVAW